MDKSPDMPAPDDQPIEVLDSKVAECVSAMQTPPRQAIQVSPMRHNSGVRADDAVLSIPARSLSEVIDWFSANVNSQRSRKPNVGSINKALSILVVLAFRLRFGQRTGGALRNQSSRALPIFSSVARAKT